MNRMCTNCEQLRIKLVQSIMAAISALLLRQGIPPQQLARLHAPIGLDLGGQRPEELAVGILAEMIAVKNTGASQPVRRDDAQ